MVLVPLNVELLQMNHLLMFLGCIYSGRSCGEDYHSVAIFVILFKDLSEGCPFKMLQEQEWKST